MAVGALYLLGWCPIYERIYHHKVWLSDVANSRYKILYHTGHGTKHHLVLNNKPFESIQPYEIGQIDTNHYKFVFIDSCYSDEHRKKFGSICSLGYTAWVFSLFAVLFDTGFWLRILHYNEPVKTAYDKTNARITQKLHIPSSWIPIALYGNGNITLKR
jgi:hypothetical protein